MEWEIPDTEDTFGEILDKAENEGPQHVRRLGKLYVVSAVKEEPRPRNRLVEILLNGPTWDEVEIERIRGKMRDVESPSRYM